MATSLPSLRSLMPPPPITRYQLGSIFPEAESETVELKEITADDPVDPISKHAGRYPVSFLNREGGSIYWGVEDASRRIVGVRLTEVQHDLVHRAIVGKLKDIAPAIDLTSCQVVFHPVAGGATQDLWLVQLQVPKGNAELYYASGNTAYVRIGPTTAALTGPEITEWIKRSVKTKSRAGGQKTHGDIASLVARVRAVFTANGLEPAHLPRFIKTVKAPFTLTLADLKSEEDMIHWIDDQKLDWICETFLLRRPWLDGEDQRIHQEFNFDKKPSFFLSTISDYADAPAIQENLGRGEAYLIQWGVGKDWHKKGETRVFMVVRFPIMNLSHELTVYKYVADFGPSPWEYGRTNIELRAFVRLLWNQKGISTYGRAISHKDGLALESNELMLPELFTGRMLERVKWEPDDYAHDLSESLAAQDLDTFPEVIAYLQRHGLPWQGIKLSLK